MQEDIKRFIKSYSELKAKKEITDRINKFSSDSRDNKEYSLMEIKIQIIESCLKILTKDEREILYAHLIDNLKWSEIVDLKSNKNSIYSERTYKRIQKSALSKIENFIDENKIENYIFHSEMSHNWHVIVTF